MGEPSLGLGPVPRRCGVALSTPQRRQNLLKCAQEEEKRAAAYNFEATPKIKASIERKLHELRKCEGHRADNKKNLDLRLALVDDVDELVERRKAFLGRVEVLQWWKEASEKKKLAKEQEAQRRKKKAAEERAKRLELRRLAAGEVRKKVRQQYLSRVSSPATVHVDMLGRQHVDRSNVSPVRRARY